MILNDDSSNINNRWICIFKPAPVFYCNPVDMDDVLSYKPKTFKSLRTFWKKSFTKMSNEENNSFVILEVSNNKNSIFGNWDYISHQVEASPFKPVEYMDKIDIFGYRFINIKKRGDLITLFFKYLI